MRNLFPSEICSAWNSLEISDKGNIIIQLIIFRRDHEQGDPIKVLLPLNLLTSVLHYESVQEYDIQLKGNAPLLESVPYVKDPLNQIFPQLLY